MYNLFVEFSLHCSCPNEGQMGNINRKTFLKIQTLFVSNFYEIGDYEKQNLNRQFIYELLYIKIVFNI